MHQGSTDKPLRFAEKQEECAQWWRRRWAIFNGGVLLAHLVGFAAYLIVLDVFAATIGRPYVDGRGQVMGYDVDVGGIGACSGCGGIILGMIVANGIYQLGPVLVELFDLKRVRWRVWGAISAGCCLAPFSIAGIHLVCCLFYPDFYDHTPVVIP